MKRFVEAFFVIGLLTFTFAADFDQYCWQVTYSLWDKGLTALLFYIVCNPSKQKASGPVFVLASLRVAWELASVITGVNINDSRVVSILFIIYCFYVLYAIAKNVRN